MNSTRPFLPAFLLFTLLLALALPAIAADQPKEFMGVWVIDAPPEVAAQIAEAEKAVKEKPDDEMAKAMLEMLKVVTSMEMEFTTDAIIMRAAGEEKERASWSATKNADGSYTLSVKEPDGKDSPAKATIKDGVLSIHEDGSEPLKFKKK
jgi:hypothetical protein